MPPVSAPADRRFRRSHVKPSSRRRSRLRALWTGARVVAVLTLAAYAAWRGVALVSGAAAFRVAHVTVIGNERLSTGEVMALIDGLRGAHILGLRLDEWRDRLRSSPWVEDATLRRVLPSTVEVRVRERRPMALARVGSGLYLIDPHGVVVDEFGPPYADLDMPLVDGLLSPAEGRPAAVDETRTALAARVIAALAARPDIESKVSQIDVHDPHDAVVMLEGDTAMLRLGEDDFVERLQQYLDLGDALRERVAAIDYVDLRFAERLYVRPARRPAAAPASAGVRR
ncbi:MAG TPA: FtsQ-type POTRA domain-containing protein [Vicinamibacterales bacterium]|nr:FtsQ-type POTRA domain-containing protein [Vicinamibacterales bacterium]